MYLYDVLKVYHYVPYKWTGTSVNLFDVLTLFPCQEHVFFE